jgi:hypothetical protein
MAIQNSEKMVIIDRLSSYLASKPRTAATLVLTLAVAFVLVLAGLALELSDFGQAPYPSQDLGFSTVGDNVLFTQGLVMKWHNETSNETFPMTPYAGALAAFGGGGYGWGTFPFGDDPSLSAQTGAPSTQYRDWDGSVGLSWELTDLTSNGFFDQGDTVLFTITSLKEDVVFYFALAFFPYGSLDRPSCTEMSFAIHDGKLYSWYSDNLPSREPWYAPFY